VTRLTAKTFISAGRSALRASMFVSSAVKICLDKYAL
jgi:hypothetical protein